MRLLKRNAYADFSGPRVSGKKWLETRLFSSWGINRLHWPNLTALCLLQSSHQDPEVKRPTEAGPPVCRTAGHEALQACERRGAPWKWHRTEVHIRWSSSFGSFCSQPRSSTVGKQKGPAWLPQLRENLGNELSCSVPQFSHL